MCSVLENQTNQDVLFCFLNMVTHLNTFSLVGNQKVQSEVSTPLQVGEVNIGMIFRLFCGALRHKTLKVALDMNLKVAFYFLFISMFNE